MRAMVFEEVGQPLRAVERPVPEPAPGQLLLKVHACGVCRTDLHLLDGELQIADAAAHPRPRDRRRPSRRARTSSGFAVGAASASRGWAGPAAMCAYCRSGRENLCPLRALHRARHRRRLGRVHASPTSASASSSRPATPTTQAAPLLCAGLIGYRALRMAADARRLGLYGFGAAAHILAQVARWQGRRVFAFTRPGDIAAQTFARELGAAWAGGSDEPPPEPLDAAILFAPVGALVPLALRALAHGGTVVCGGIHMSDIPSFPYAALWEERVVRSVANLTRHDAEEFLALAPARPGQDPGHRLPAGGRQRRAGGPAGGAVHGGGGAHDVMGTT